MNIPQQFLDEIIEEAKFDEIGLWFIVRRICDDLGVVQPALLQAATLQCVNLLLASRAVVAGEYKSDGSYEFEEWNMEPERIISRIEKAWNELGREPDIGEIVVFVGKDAG